MNIEKMQKANSDGERKRLDKNYRKLPLLGEVNEPVECVILLKRLNQMIDTLYCLSDDYYRDYIFNQTSTVIGELEENNFDEDYFMNLAEKMEKLRGILFREAFDYDNLVELLQDEVMANEIFWHRFYKKRSEELDYKIKKLEESK